MVVVDERTKSCPNCGQQIPMFWKKHFECGWDSTKETKEPEQKRMDEIPVNLDAKTLVKECLNESIQILTDMFQSEESKQKDFFFNIEHIIMVADQIRRTKISERIER